ncbi:phospholipase D family protein [Campylobacterota bacterium DY0563]
MKLLSNNKAIENKIVKLINEYNEIYILTAWATLGSKVTDVLVKHKEYISKMVVGINGFSTSPEFIQEFRDCKNIKYMLGTNGIFHPKIYLFYNSKKEWECLVGSANLTYSGMTKNIETMIHIESDNNNSKSFIDSIIRDINKYFSLGYRMTDEKYEIYLKKYNYQKKNKENIKKSNETTEKEMADISIDKLSWKEFFEKTKNNIDDSLEERLQLLNYVNGYFQKYKSLENMPEDIIKQLSGITNKGEGDIDWMYFGNMVSPHFKSNIIASKKYYSEALDLIPLQGTINKKLYMDFISYVEKNLPSGYGAKVKTLSRLLAMKRPDTFYCITSNNEYPLYRDFDIKPLYNNEFERYWDDIIVNIHNSPWYDSNQPIKLEEKRVWNVRAAMLDIITY